jgi:hypothetical protein
LLQEAKFFGLKRQHRTMEIINEIKDVVSTWRDVFQQFQTPDSDIETRGKDIKKSNAHFTPLNGIMSPFFCSP